MHIKLSANLSKLNEILPKLSEIPRLKRNLVILSVKKKIDNLHMIISE